MDFINKLAPRKPEDILAEAKANGGWVIDDDAPTHGFEEDVTDDPSYHSQEVLDLEKRRQDSIGKTISQVDELTKQFHEGNENAVRKFRFNFQDEYTQWVPGKVLKLADFLAMLQKIRPDAFVATEQRMGLRGLGFIQNRMPTYSGISVQDVAPEWSQLRVDARGLPTTLKYRGWRDVLLTCIKGGFVTEQQCYDVFGRPAGPRSRPWYRQLYAIRNGSCGECRKQFCECGYATAWERLRADNYAYEVPEEVTQGKRQEVYESRIYVP